MTEHILVHDATWIADDATQLRSDMPQQVDNAQSTVPVPRTSSRRSRRSTPPTDDAAQLLHAGFELLTDTIGQVVVGKPIPIRLCVTALLAGGHVLIEDDPGTGKTQLAKGLARSVDVPFNRIQFTADLLPSDIIGVTFYERSRSTFSFRPGPVFASIVLADEINRASAKTQSALLEVMEERKVTVDGTTHTVPDPFMVIATQNPIDQLGTYRLPEAQLDRFLIRTSIGHPGHEASLALAKQVDVPDRAASVRPVIDGPGLAELRSLASAIHIAPVLLDYMVRIIEYIRHDETTASGPSTRGLLSLVRCVRIWAAAEGRHFVIPDDVKALAVPILAHRIMLQHQALMSGDTPERAVVRALDNVPVPTVDEAHMEWRDSS